MVSRNIKAVIEVGGQVAASLPSSVRRARGELQHLEQAQQGDIRRLRELRQSLGYVAEGSQAYARRQQQIAQVQSTLDYRVDKIQAARRALSGASGETAGFTSRLASLRAGLGPVGIAVGAVTGAVTALALAFRSAGRDANDLISTSALYGRTVEDIQRRRNFFQFYTQDAGRAQAAARNLLDVTEQFQRVRFGAGAGPEQFLGTARLGFNPGDLIQGRLNQRQILQQAIKGVQGLEPVEARLRLEQAGFSEDVRAAVLVGAREGLGPALRYQERQAVLSQEQLRANRDMGRNIGEMLSQVRRLVQIALSGIAPPLISMSGAVLRWLAGPEGALKAKQQELQFDRGELEARRRPLQEEARRSFEANPIDAPTPEIAALRETDAAMRAIDRRLAQIPDELARLQESGVSQKFPGPLGNLPGAQQAASAGLNAKDVLDILSGGLTGNPIPSNIAVTNIFDTAGQTASEISREIVDGILRFGAGIYE